MGGGAQVGGNMCGAHHPLSRRFFVGYASFTRLLCVSHYSPEVASALQAGGGTVNIESSEVMALPAC